MTRKRKLFLNTFTALVLQVVTLVCGFILPRQILIFYGSEVNGLVNSITRFLGVISFLELGIGPVIQSNLYKPLAENDTESISRIIKSAEKFYRKIAYIFLVYIVILMFVFPRVNKEFERGYTISLLLIISFSTFAQYFFGITYQIFLNADQKVYVQSGLQIITVILNTVLSIIFIRLGYSIHIVKLISTIVFVIRPLAQNLYVRQHYEIDHKITYDEEPIKQKWNGFAQHLAAVVCDNVDVVLLTWFSTYQNVSIYSIYYLVAGGVNKLAMTTASGLESFWGNMIAKDENELLYQSFEVVETLTHFLVCFLFTTTAILISPFVMVYVAGVDDASAYYVPLFGILLSTAYGIQCLRVPYFRMIKAAGHYKQTQNGAFISMILNIVLSVLLLFRLDLVGVAIGTIVAMAYHTIYFAWYLRKNIINRPFRYFLKHIFVDMFCIVLACLTTRTFYMEEVSYGGWFIYAIKISIIILSLTLAIHALFYRNEVKIMLDKIKYKNKH